MPKMPKINFPLYAVKRIGISKRTTWLIRGGAVLVALLLAGVMSTFLTTAGTPFIDFYKGLFVGTFNHSEDIITLLCGISIYLLLAIAVAPAFRMKFWNIGGEGQAMAGAIVTAIILLKMPSTMPDTLVIIMALIGGVLAGIIWAVIPAIFKVKCRTNETLFTLMMNYIATFLAAFVIAFVNTSHPESFPEIDPNRTIIKIFGIKYIPIVIAAVVLTFLLYFYLKKTKHGYELSVIGNSTNTARYIGMKSSWIAIRTMIMSGAISGLVGFLIVCAQTATLSSGLISGRGFTAVLIAWLGHFNPAEIAIYSCLVGFLDQGSTYAASLIGANSTYFSGVIIGLVMLVVVTAEFFINYQVKVRDKKIIEPKKKKEAQ
ncbi:MAG: ABC transporter permease [Bacilli bacterium]|nr:ABC transporter permease [Bacilli bacterium]